ncbi:MAG: hypothetical protein PUP93_07795 [Rhizonema sp. NSF051]|nr:hypothetical protein [Rhizonema sp. NSF051]
MGTVISDLLGLEHPLVLNQPKIAVLKLAGEAGGERDFFSCY